MIAPFNTWWFVFFGVSVALLVLGSVLLRKSSRALRLRVILIAGIVLFIGFWLYRYGMWADPEYYYDPWEELPLNLCNIAVFLIPLAAIFDNRTLQMYCFLNCSIGAIIGAAISENAFKNIPVLSARGFGYYGTHFVILALCISFVAFGVYRPRFRDIPIAGGLVFLSAGAAHLINLLFRATVCENANFFFTFGLAENSLITSIYNILPIPYLYEALFLLPYILLTALVILPFELTAKKKKQEE